MTELESQLQNTNPHRYQTMITLSTNFLAQKKKKKEWMKEKEDYQRCELELKEQLKMVIAERDSLVKEVETSSK